jgi:hypothetical protein
VNRFSVVITAALALGLSSIAPASAQLSSSANYMGRPDPGLALALVQAGGGAGNFTGFTLVQTLTGEMTQAERATLNERYGAKNVDVFVDSLTFVVNDALVQMKRSGMRPARRPNPDTGDPAVLSAALYKDGTPPGMRQFAPGYLLARLFSPSISARAIANLDANPNFGPGADRDFQTIFTQFMNDLKSGYGT